MAIEIEKEFKNLLTKEEYTHLLANYEKQLTHHVTQINSYFDFQDMLKNHKCALRIRMIEDCDYGEVTLKIPKSLVEVIEINERFLPEQLQVWIDKKELPLPKSIQEALQKEGIPLTTAYMIANLKTIRKEGHLNDDTLLVLDHSFYNNTEDFELEMEVKDLSNGEKLFKKILDEHSIIPRKTASKIKRALTY
ncbi:Uncharacterized protein YjbK [Granulicatella balaenopterae]|uniref:Uncharacterized protein YjbK n=1 Tax=Granulicatella balaenopterae TaxID=137733 RepID=A0A1H9MMB1_9LACT|nr:CYTH domain-containing protein [Granulicatella balaenopterae]SER24822.1 Uncharacterized protein YjbK [Granulicatella balaenopterae]